jgi:hypothetical protein
MKIKLKRGSLKAYDFEANSSFLLFVFMPSQLAQISQFVFCQYRTNWETARVTNFGVRH